MNKHCLVVLSGGARKNRNGEWKTYGILGDKFRIVAAHYLWNKDKNFFIVASGAKGELVNKIDEPLAEIIAQELTESGVKRKMIIKEPRSNNTHEQLLRLPGLIKKYKFGSTSIISNEWHLPRIMAMIENMVPDLKNILLKNEIKFVAAENVLLKADPRKWTTAIQKIRTSKAMKIRIDKEKKGIQNILSGTYKSTH